MNNINREELENALAILTGDNGTIYPACALSNPESAGHSAVVHALCVACGGAVTDYLIRDEWYTMDEEEQDKYAGDYAEFCDACDSFNSSIINKAITDLRERLEK